MKTIDLEAQLAATAEKYKCGCIGYEPGIGCTDCLNKGYIFDNIEIYLAIEFHDLYQKLRNAILEIKRQRKIEDGFTDVNDAIDTAISLIEEKE